MGPGTHIGKYRLLRRLGSGGMGDVWEAVDEKLGRTVAIKCVSEAGSGEVERQARLVQEARNLAQLEHEGIVKIYDCLDEPGRIYLVMQFVSGSTLAEVVRDRGPVSEIQCLEYLRQTAAALAAAHARGIFHRDLKPSNIMVDRMGKTTLIDFGLALSSTQSRITQTGRAVGTFPFMAPEQIHGQECDARTDVYALALTIYNLLTGCVPVRRPDGSHAYAPPPGVLPALDRVLRRCLAGDPAQRYPSAEDLLQDIRMLTQTAPERTRPGSSGTRNRRSRVFVWASACAAAGVGVALLVIRPWDGPVAAETVLIPAGEFIAGMDLDDVPEAIRGHSGVESLTQGGRRRVLLGSFEIDKFEVSNAEYARFVEASGRSPPSHWQGQVPPPSLARHPVVNVTREDAEAYAQWTGKRLPSADEWEKAARGADGRVYPWGNGFEPHACNTLESQLEGTCAVDAFPHDASPYGVVGLGGNVSEWTSSLSTDEAGERARVICGGSWLESGRIVALAAFRRRSTAAAYSHVGFRCVRSVSSSIASDPSPGEVSVAATRAHADAAARVEAEPEPAPADTGRGASVVADVQGVACPLAVPLDQVRIEIVRIEYVTSASGLTIPEAELAHYRLGVVTLKITKPAGRPLKVAAADLTLHYRHGAGHDVAPCEGISEFGTGLDERRVVTFYERAGPGWVKQETRPRETQAGIVYLEAVFHMIEPSIAEAWLCVGQPVRADPVATPGWKPSP